MTIPFSTSNLAGVDFDEIYVAPAVGAYNYGTSNPAFEVGTLADGADGSKWVYVKYGVGGATGLGFVMAYNEAFLAIMLNTTSDLIGQHVGVAPAAALVDNYGWLQIYGTCDNMQVLASCAANVNLGTTATSGALDDGATGGLTVSGVVLTTARAASQGNAPAILNYPVVTSATAA